MSVGILESYGTFNPHHPILRKLGCNPCERDVFAKVTNLIKNCGQAYVCLSEYSKELGYAKGSISRAIGRLVKKDLLKRTGQKKFNMFPYVEVLPLNSENRANTSFSQPLTKLLTPLNQTVNDPSPFGQTQEIREDINKNLSGSEPKKIFPEKPTKSQHLKNLLLEKGISSKKVKSLMRFPSERIERQLNHLEDQKAQGSFIDNEAGWLINAIEKNYRIKEPRRSLTKTLKTETNNLPTEAELKQAEENTKLNNLLRNAEYEFNRENYDEAEKYLKESQIIKQTSRATALLEKIKISKEKSQAKDHLLANTPKELYEEIFKEEFAKESLNFTKFGGPEKFSEFIKVIAEQNTIKRLQATP